MGGKAMALLLVVTLLVPSVPVDFYAKSKEQGQIKEEWVAEIGERAEKAEEKEEADELRKAAGAKIGEIAKETEVTQVSDLASLFEAVASEEDELGREEILENPWQSKRLLVKSQRQFDTHKAKSLICGYEDLYILDYESQEDAQKAYEALREEQDLCVEVDQIYVGATEDDQEERVSSALQTNGNMDTGVKDVVVAVLDTGYDTAGCGTDRILGGIDLTESGSIMDRNGHGTVMANIILEHTPQSVLVMPVKIAGEQGCTTSLKLYMGICYAMEHGADLIQISMNAYRSAVSDMVSEAICEAEKRGILVVVSAGNAGADASDYSPANVKEAIVVSAVNADGTLLEYSNYGNTVDYCAYGKIQATGIGKKARKAAGTSVSAAIVAAVIAGNKAIYPDLSDDCFLGLLDAQAKDLGDAGGDIFYGKGLLALESLQALMEDVKKVYEEPLLACDWKNLEKELLNERIAQTDERVVRIFLDRMTEEERQEIRDRADFLQGDHVEVVCGIDGQEKSRTIEPFYDYLYSDRFEEYCTQMVLEGTYYMYVQSSVRKVHLTTNQDTRKCTLHVKFPAIATNPANNPNITISGTSAGAFDLTQIKIDGVRTITDDNGNANTISQIGVSKIKVAKRAHSIIKGYERAHRLNGKFQSDLWSGGFTGYGSNTCKEESSENCKVILGIGDLELAKDNKTIQTYKLNITNCDYTPWTDWSDWVTTKKATCNKEGEKYHTRTRKCKNCKKLAQTEKKTKAIARLSHKFKNAPWNYQANNHIANGERYVQCLYSCGTETKQAGYDVNGDWWRKNYQYLQTISYRYMDVDGNYPAVYTNHVNGYYAPGTKIGGWSYRETDTSEFKTAYGVSSYTVTDKANSSQISVPRKKYHVVYDGNGAETGSVQAQKNICCGKTFTLNQNAFMREGYEFVGWSRSPYGEDIMDEHVKNLSFQDGATVRLYAKWEPVRMIRFDANLTEEDLALIGADEQGVRYEEPAICPFDRKKPRGESVTVSFADVILKNKTFADVYRLKGWSLTPVIENERELVLSRDRAACTFTEEKDVTLYAQWDTSFLVAYIGNGQSEGENFLDEAKCLTQDYTLAKNRFKKTVEKPTVDIESGRTKNEAGEPYMEEIPCSLQGFCMENEKEMTASDRLYLENTVLPAHQLIEDADEALTFGKPVEDYGFYELSEKTIRVPFISLYAVWDEYPQIHASNLYFSLSDAQNGVLTQEYLLGFANAEDEELKSPRNEKGVMKHGLDAENKTSFTIPDYQAADFTGAQSEMSLTITYRAKDQASNVTQKTVTVFLVDTSGKEYDEGRVRFISEKYLDTLSEYSIWRTERYAKRLAKTLGNKKTGQEYTVVTPVQKALGIKSVCKPGSGNWQQVQQIWRFTHQQAVLAQTYVEQNKGRGNSSEFLQKFAACRVM